MSQQEERNFPRTVIACFGFLETLGFRLVSESSSHVSYYSRDISFDLAQDFRNGYISVDIRRARDGKTLTLGDICDASGVVAIPLQAWTPEYTQRAIRWLARLFEREGRAILRADGVAWDAALSVRQERSTQSALNSELLDMRYKLDDLWKRRDYAGIIRLMTPLEAHLKPSEIKKLRIARREIRGEDQPL